MIRLALSAAMTITPAPATDTWASYAHEVRSPAPAGASVLVTLDGRPTTMQRFTLGSGETIRVTVGAPVVESVSTGPAPECSGKRVSVTVSGAHVAITVERLSAAGSQNTVKSTVGLPGGPSVVASSICLAGERAASGGGA